MGFRSKEGSAPSDRHYYDFSAIRVIQHNLVYVTNLPENISEESVLRSSLYFGQYGEILKCIVSKSKLSKSASNAYITYSSPEEAALCIRASNLFSLTGHVLEATLGTTRYCTHFLGNANCPRADCLFLHERYPDSEIVLKDVYSQNRRTLYISSSLANQMQFTVELAEGTILPNARKLTEEELTEKQLE